MRTAAIVSIVAFGVMVATAADAAPGPKVSITGSETIAAPKRRIAASTKRIRGQPFKLTATYRTPSGGTITGQQFVDLANKLQAVAEKGGCSLGSGKTCAFQLSDAKMTTAQLNQATKLVTKKITLKKIAVPKKTTAENAAKSPLGFQWDKEWGNRDKAAVYLGAEFGNDGSNKEASCGGTAYAGIYLFGNQKEVIRLEGEAYAKASGSGTSAAASAELKVMGDSVWSKAENFTTSKLSYERSYYITKSFTYWGFITLTLKAKATGNAYITGSLSGTASSSEYVCSLNLTPGVKATAGGTAQVSVIGYGNISAQSVGVDADVVLADVSVPIVASVSAKNKAGGSVTFTESLKVTTSMNYLSGSLDVWFKTSFPLDGESWYDWDTDKLSFNLLEWDGWSYNETLFNKNASQTL